MGSKANIASVMASGTDDYVFLGVVGRHGGRVFSLDTSVGSGERRAPLHAAVFEDAAQQQGPVAIPERRLS